MWACFQKLLSAALQKKYPNSSTSAASELRDQFENRETIARGNYKSVQEEINQIMD